MSTKYAGYRDVTVGAMGVMVWRYMKKLLPYQTLNLYTGWTGIPPTALLSFILVLEMTKNIGMVCQGGKLALNSMFLEMIHLDGVLGSKNLSACSLLYMKLIK